MTTKVHVHLFYGADPRFYRPGENIGCLYGYHHAESDEFQLSYSQDAKESKPVRLVRRALKTLLGFDLIHTLRNRDEMLRSDVIWTHTEQEWLSAALMLLMNGKRQTQPLLLAQSVWLIDKWPNYGLLRRWFYRKLIARADLLTTLARDNAELCREYFGRDATQLFYGLNTRDFPVQQPKAWQPDTPLRIAAIGNDRDRDWETLIKAVGNDPRFAVRLATRRRIPRALRSLNVQVAPAAGLKKQRELYDWADVVVVPLRPNTHASGITVMLEAAAVGKPMVVTNVGGLQDYFSARAAAYVPPFDADALREALLGLIASPDKALQQAQAASMQLVSRDHTTQHYAQQHVKLTRDLLRRQAQHAHPAQQTNAGGNTRVPSQSRGGM
ncbi:MULTISPECIES: glycosyltransferase family 4 protein [Paraburkholderia]|jgi:glycosyltransferase involved in cell wall biosynthesis|uniref:Glycosyl transferase n=1 Tax=Paraburkholderia caribensis TaxID=75105 RepID=A0A9Q6WJT7_9BURK|nr:MULTISPECIES: glycosyltransferase family 4 protein [Paraburkholderia]ALP63012.1 glycosyl transferase [Paraburkholderia caribensis]AUT51750.1 glycosyl transferase [Paraburkholderia caribensis]MCO4880387.1 glycosyltransferase family 4 protein [Paraburkholderia caribensis]PTB25910.1 glycosyl transferase [Paraburkholderia caribensis]QLB61143.1 glycosyl transferase [Paraburkholderia caribensis]